MSGRRIWVDVEDVFTYAASHKRASGIQRLAFEILCELVAMDETEVRFVRHLAPPGLTAITWEDVRAVFARMDRPLPAPRTIRSLSPTSSDAGLRGLMRRLAFRFPATIQGPLMRGLRAQHDAALSLGEAGLMTLVLTAGWLRRLRKRPASGADILAQMTPGDLFLVLGSPWFPFYERRLDAVRARGGRVVLLVYDMIPVMRPEWCDASLVRTFRGWMRACLPLADQVFAISRATARDTEAFAAGEHLALAAPVQALPIGTGLSEAPTQGAQRADLPRPGSYVLFVSTIEPRKNHALLFRVWRELLATIPRERIPTLVFAGRVGWMSGDLMRQLANADWLGGLIRHVDSPTNAELRTLYEGAMFTIFPSLYEGWGLPVTESLALGKPCLVARTTSLPEAGGTLARYFDPDNLHDTVAAVRTLIEDPAGLAAWEADIRRGFAPVSWRETACSLLAGIEKMPSSP